MYLCICNAIRERHVDVLLEQGSVRTVSEVFRHLGKTPQCGSCAATVRERLQRWTGRVGAPLPTAAE
jgi:bacterioferritin-associated ferredoxin